MPEVLNAIQQAMKEVQTRFDLKSSKSQIDLNEKDKKIVIQSIDDFKLKAVVEVLQQKLAKRKVPLKNFAYGPIVPAAGSTARQEISIQYGIPVEKSREIVKKIKDSKIRVQASIQGDLVRVSGKSRDLLQEVLQLLRASERQFQTGWFLESLMTELFIVLVIRTRGPFFRSRPGTLLLTTTLFVAGTTIFLPYTPLGALFGFVPLPAGFVLLLLAITGAYLLASELVKGWFFRRFA